MEKNKNAKIKEYFATAEDITYSRSFLLFELTLNKNILHIKLSQLLYSPENDFNLSVIKKFSNLKLKNFRFLSGTWGRFALF